jgi:anti-sigma regulatory factor (Ser/Thr protein kinase)/CheY-like chemotaxis protein
MVIEVTPGESSWLAENLALQNCNVEVASGEAKALQLLRQRSFEVVLTSPQTLPKEDLALLDEMRRIRPGVRTILLAPETTPDDVIAALRAQVFSCFSAPFDLKAITTMVKRALEEVDWRNDIEVVSAHPDWIELRVACRLLTAERLTTFMTELLASSPDQERFQLMTAFREILMNAMEHGAGFDPEKVVEVAAVRTERAIVYFFRDPGRGFRRDSLPHAAISNPLDDPTKHMDSRTARGLRPGGFGILMAREMVDEIIYNEVGNEVLLIKHTL